MAELFGVDRTVITKHLGNIFKEGELMENSVCSIFAHTAADGKIYRTNYYNLDAIIAVGYRVNSYQATRFRIWATKTLREFLIKGFVMDDERLKQGKRVFGKDYFDELSDPARQRQGQRAGGEAQSGRAIRGLPPAAGCGIHFGLRPRNQAH
jgi:hypothetical protein